MSRLVKLTFPIVLLVLMVAQATACPPFDTQGYATGGNNHGGSGMHNATPLTGEVFTEAKIVKSRFDLDPGDRWEEAVVCLVRTPTVTGKQWIRTKVHVKGGLYAFSHRLGTANASVYVVLWKNGVRVSEKLVDDAVARNGTQSKLVDQVVWIGTEVYAVKGVPITFCGGIRSVASVNDKGGGTAHASFGSAERHGLVLRLAMKPMQ